MGRTLLKALIRQKSDEFRETAAQKQEQGDPIQHFENQPPKHDGPGVMHSKEGDNVKPYAHSSDADNISTTKKIISVIVRDIKTSEPHVCPDSKFRIYKLKRPSAKSILANLKSDIIKEIIKFKHCLNIIDTLRFLDGNILMFEKQVIFRLNFEAQAMYSIVINRKGDVVNLCILPKRLIDDSKQKRPVQKFLDPQKMRTFENRFLQNLHASLDYEPENDILVDIFGIHPSGRGIFIDGQLIRNKNEIYFEMVALSKFKFSLIMDLNGNFLDITSSQSESDTHGLMENAFHRNNLFPAVNLFSSNIDGLL